MSRKKKYFMTQKAVGLGMIIFSIVVALIYKDATLAIGLIPVGCLMVFTKNMILMNKYYFEVEEEKEFRRKMRRAYR